MKQFVENVKRIEEVMKGWAKIIYYKSQKELKDLVEVGINALFEHNDVGIFSKYEAQVVKELEGREKDLLDKEEITYRLKIRAIWIKE